MKSIDRNCVIKIWKVGACDIKEKDIFQLFLKEKGNFRGTNSIEPVQFVM